MGNFFLLLLWFAVVLALLFVLELAARGIRRYQDWRYQRSLRYFPTRPRFRF